MATLLYFGRLSDVTGILSEEVQLPKEICTAGDLRLWLDQRFEASGTLLEPTVRIAVNSEISFDADPVRNGDEIAFMPPVGGG